MSNVNVLRKLRLLPEPPPRKIGAVIRSMKYLYKSTQGVSYNQKFRGKRDFPNLTNCRTSLFLKILRVPKCKTDSGIKMLQ